MSDEVSNRFAAALAIRDNGRISFGAAGAAAISPHFFAVGRLLSQKKKKPEPRSVIGTLTSVWDLGSRLQMRSVGDRFVLRFSRREDRDHVLHDGPWFYGRAMFAVAVYDGLSDAASVPITTFPVWVEILGLPPALMTLKAVELLGATLGRVDHPDRLGITSGRRAKVKIIHSIFDPVRAAFPPMTYEFGSSKVAVNLSFKYEKTTGFCRICGLLEHYLGGCRGAPDVSGVQQIGRSATLTQVRGGVPPGFGDGSVRSTGESSRGVKVINPNPSTESGPVQASVGMLSGSRPQLVLPSLSSNGGVGSLPAPVRNLFSSGSGGSFFGKTGSSNFALTIPGMSPADMASGFARMLGSSVITPEVPVPVVAASSKAPTEVLLITGAKRSANSEIAALGKRVRGPERTEACPLELPFTPELALAHEDGHIKVSPQKRRRGGGRPKGSKNKPKMVGSDQSGTSSGPKRAKRRYTSKRALDLVDNSGEGMVSGGDVVDSGSGSGSSSIFESSAGSGSDIGGGGSGTVMQAVAGDGAPPGATIA